MEENGFVCNSYTHKEDDVYFAEAFSFFSELRKNNVMTDIVLTTSFSTTLSASPDEIDDFFCGNQDTQKARTSTKNECKVTIQFSIYNI